MTKHKDYLGDGVYVDIDERMPGIVLTTEDGISIQNTIFLEPSVYVALLRWHKRMEKIEV